MSDELVLGFNDTQCQSLISLFRFMTTNSSEPIEPITFEHVYVSRRRLSRSYPRLFYLYDSLTPDVYDLFEDKFNSLQLQLKFSDSAVFGKQYYWVVYSDNPHEAGVFQNGVDFWIINATVLSRGGFDGR